MASMMGMGGMDGMPGMSGIDTPTVFAPTNMRIARAYWYAIALVVALLTSVRLAKLAERWRRRRLQRQHPRRIVSRPAGPISQVVATTTAILREMSYPQPLLFTGRLSRYFSPMPLGQWIALAIYWTALLIVLWSNVILAPTDALYGYKWEIVGFRAAWVSVTQIPFVYLLSCKFNPISILTGISYERFNWLHRWAARTVFLTVIVHWSFFFREWFLSDFVATELEMMTMVQYGFGAWAVLGWMVLTGFGFVRAKSYELFVAQHIAAAATLLWLLYMHVPPYARYNVYLSVAFVVLDWGMRIGWNVMRNMHFLGRSIGRAPGYSARLEPLSGDMVRLSIDEVDFDWKAGQHMYLSIPSLRPFELHPFTIANVPGSQPAKPKALSFIVKAHRGFSKSLHQAAVKGLETSRTRRAFLSGPWGMPPDLLHYDTVVLVATSSGASFTTPLLEELVRKRGCVRKVMMHWIIRSAQDYAWYSEALDNLVALAKTSDFGLQVVVHVTRSAAAHGSVLETSPSETHLMGSSSKSFNAKADVRSTKAASDLSSLASFEDEKVALAPQGPALSPPSFAMSHAGRPDVASLIRPPVEAALGETAVVVCGGLSITAQARTFVARLSDERATHKGSGAQGIFLFTESYGW